MTLVIGLNEIEELVKQRSFDVMREMVAVRGGICQLKVSLDWLLLSS